jgi:hypothetical protein
MTQGRYRIDLGTTVSSAALTAFSFHQLINQIATSIDEQRANICRKNRGLNKTILNHTPLTHGQSMTYAMVTPTVWLEYNRSVKFPTAFGRGRIFPTTSFSP